MSELHFLRPMWLLLLPLVPLLVAWAARRGETRVWARVVDPVLLDHLLVREPASGRLRWPRWLMTLA